MNTLNLEPEHSSFHPRRVRTKGVTKHMVNAASGPKEVATFEDLCSSILVLLR